MINDFSDLRSSSDYSWLDAAEKKSSGTTKIDLFQSSPTALKLVVLRDMFFPLNCYSNWNILSSCFKYEFGMIPHSPSVLTT